MTDWTKKGVRGLPGAFLVTFCAYKKSPGVRGRGGPAEENPGPGRKVNAAAGGREGSLGWGAPETTAQKWARRRHAQPGGLKKARPATGESALRGRAGPTKKQRSQFVYTNVMISS